MHRIQLLLLLSATLFTLAIGQRRLSRRTKRLEDQVKLLQTDVDELKKHVVSMNNTLRNSCSCNGASVTNNTRTANQSKPSIADNPFWIFEIRRFDIGSGRVNYTVKYSVDARIPSHNVFSRWQLVDTEYNYHILDGTSFQHAANISTSVVTTPENQTSVLLVLGTAKLWHVLRLNNTYTWNMTLFNVSLPKLHVVPREVVYTMGKDVSFQVQMSKDPSAPRYFGMVDNVLTSAGTRYFVDSSRRLESSNSRVVFSNRSADMNVANVTLDMTHMPLSGVITLKTAAKHPSGLLLDSVDVYRRAVIRPSNQSGPFDRSLFDFYAKNIIRDSNGTLAQHCTPGVLCRVHCPLAVGANKTRMEIWYRNQSAKIITTQRVVEDPYYVTEMLGRVPQGVEEFFCNATSMMSNRTITTPGIKINWPSRASLRVTDIRRSGLGSESVLYSVEYTVNDRIPTHNVFSRWHRVDKEYNIHNLNGSSHQEGETFTSSVVTTAENQTSVLFVFGTPKLWYTLRLNNSNILSMTVDNPILPKLQVKPQEVVYTMGRINVSFQVQMSKDLSFSRDFSVVDDVLTSAGTRYFVDSFRRLESSNSRVVFSNRSADMNVANVTLDMTHMPLSGVITLKTTANHPSGLLLESVDVYRRAVIRPSNQSGPFDRGLFGFYAKNMRDSDGSLAQHCTPGVLCRVRCPLAVGANKTRMEIWYRNQSAKIITTQRVVEDPYYITEMEGYVPQGVEGFFCNATSLESNNTSTITSPRINIKWLTPAKVVAGKVRLLGDGAFYKTVRVSCSARGIPVPFMSIRFECAAGNLIFSGHELDDDVKSENFIKVSKDVVLPRQYFGQIVNVSCYAENTTGYELKKVRSVRVS